MKPRKKTRIERFFSFNQHKKRWGASKHFVRTSDLIHMKTNIVNAGKPVQTRGNCKQIDQHISNLRKEFSGQPELLWHHACLIVLIRREFRVKEVYNQFTQLWSEESEFLCENLNIRWLVSAAETFVDHDRNADVRAAGMMVTLFVNCIKLHESERYICKTEVAKPVPERIQNVKNELVPIFEGMSCFTVGTDDTLRNLKWRLHMYFDVAPTGEILKTVWNRCQKINTVFARMRKMHKRNSTQWWDDA